MVFILILGIFAYYHCTKNGNIKCNQGYTSLNNLEGQFISELEQLELDKEFEDLAFEALDIVKEQDNSVINGSFEALQLALDGVNKRIDNLVMLKISPDNSDASLLSDQEFADRKRVLLLDKEKITQQLSKLDPNGSKWVEMAEDSFNFSIKAASKFKDKNTVTDDKKLIFKVVGSNPILIDQNLQIQLHWLCFKYKEGINAMKEEKSRLVPNNGLPNQSNLDFYQKSSLWCSIWDDVRTYLSFSIDPKEKAFLLATFAHFKKKEEVHS